MGIRFISLTLSKIFRKQFGANLLWNLFVFVSAIRPVVDRKIHNVMTKHIYDVICNALKLYMIKNNALFCKK